MSQPTCGLFNLQTRHPFKSKCIIALTALFLSFTLLSCEDDPLSPDDDPDPDPDPEEQVPEDEDEISSNIEEDTELTADILYTVTSRVTVQAELSIEPGTIIQFEEDTGMRIGENGSIIADGTEQDSILFTGTEEVPGHWDGIQFHETQSTSNLMDHVIVEYGGGFNYWSQQDITANVTVGGRTSSSGARTQITNSTLREADGVGLKVTNGSTMPESGNNTYTENSEGAVVTEAHLAHYLSDTSDFTGNHGDNDYVWVEADNSLTDNDRIWEGLNVPYVIDGRVRVIDVDFTIEAGGEYHFTSDSEIEFNGDGVFLVDGSDRDVFDENGDNGEMVLFTGTEQDEGWWNGIQLQDAENPNNRIVGAVIEYAGSSDGFWSAQDAYANLVIGGRTSSHESRAEVVNTTLRYSGGYGLKISGTGSEMRNSGMNIYTGNQSGAAYTQANNIHYFDSASEYTGNNGNDFVRIEDSDVEGSSITWNALDVPYRMEGQSRPVGDVEVTIQAGAEFEFTSGAGLNVRGESALIVEGSEDNPVVFTGTEEVEGWWEGIQIRSPASANSIEYALFEYGGSEEFGTGNSANLVIGGRTSDHFGRASVTDSEFNYSEGLGIYVSDNGEAINEDICSENSFDGNQEGDCLVDED